MTTSLPIKEQSFSSDWQGKELLFKTGKLAPQADGAVVVSLGETILLVTAVMEKNPDPTKDFLPLTIDFRESYSAAGKIGGGKFRKREGRPSDQAVLNMRLTDRPMRPMFPKGMINDVVVTITPLAIDKVNDPGILCIIWWSLATMAAGIPFDGPIAAVRIGYKNGNYIINPSYDEYKDGDLNLVVAGKTWSINMIECDAAEVSEEIINKAFHLAQEEIDKVCSFQKEFLRQLTITPKTILLNKPNEEVMNYVHHILDEKKLHAMRKLDRPTFDTLFSKYESEVLEIAKEKIKDDSNDAFTESRVKMAVFDCIKYHMRTMIMEEGERLDGRKSENIRPLYCEVGLIPRVHGSGLFQRGDTQILATTTLWSPGDVEMSDTMEDQDVEKRYIHHYNMPPFSSNEAQATRGFNRREIGHGRLAEKALERIVLDQKDFPYTIRVVSDALSSGGSTSMGSVCASTLSLMDAGVPIHAPVSGIAMGIVTKHDEKDNLLQHVILTDIRSLEDFMGDMDFKVAGSHGVITAIQLDIKIKGIPLSIIKEVIQKANQGKDKILDFMLQTIDKPRAEMSPYAPKIISFKINPKKIKEVIGKGGETIDEIVRETGVKIDFEDDGTCFVTAKDKESAERAITWIKDIAEEPAIGTIINGTVTRVENYGVFVALGKNRTGLCHAKNLGLKMTDSISSVFKVWTPLTVKIISIDEDGKIALARQF